MKKLFLISTIFMTLLLVSNLSCIAQTIPVAFQWTEPRMAYHDTNTVYNSLHFEGAHYIENPIIPQTSIPLGSAESFMNFNAHLQNAIYEPFSQAELIILESSGFTPSNEPIIIFDSRTIAKENNIFLSIIPIRANPVSGLPEKLLSCTVEIEIEIDETMIMDISPKDLKTTESVLASGAFYKISVSQPGIYRLTYLNLASMGIDLSSVNPLNFRLFGNSGQMLPELNSLPRKDDLYENAVYVYGENDGTFDTGDYVLFYATGPHTWIYDTLTLEYSCSVNKYNDKSYYFLTFDKGAGKRIQTVNYMTETPVFTTGIFLDRSNYETESYNLIKSGKEWYGDVFDLSLSQSFGFSFPNVAQDSCMKIRVNMVARASGPTNANVAVGSSSYTIGFQGTSGYTSDYAKSGSISFCTSPQSSFNVNITYNKLSYNDAKAWLNRITVMAWRNLTLSGNQMSFRNPLMDSPGNFVRYQLNTLSASSVAVWDVTSPLDPVIIGGEQSGSTFSFQTAADKNGEYIAHTGLSFLSPSFEGTVENQNIHGLDQKDYLIVSHPLFADEAIQLAQFHQQLNGLSWIVITPQQIYNEFSSGSQDPVAIRDFVKMFYDRATNNDELPKYLLFFGRASYDYKNRISGNTNYIPTFQSIESLNPTSSYASDDFFGLLDSTEGYDCNGHLDIAIGRLPATTKQEAQDFINKIFRYHETNNAEEFQNTCDFIQRVPNLSDWRNWVTFISDDGNMNLHYNQSEGISSTVSSAYNYLNIDKIHLDSYPQVSTPGGERAPVVNEAINRRMLLGCLIVNYTGHGGEVGWAHERILELSDINSWENYYNMPLFITATCEFSRFDDPQRIAAGEMVLTNPNGGGIALFSTTRLAYSNYNENLNRSIYEVIFEKTGGVYPTLGEVLTYAKTDNGSNQYIRNFILLGDPAMRLAYPENQIITTEINGNSVGGDPDTLSAYSFVSVKGYVADPGGTIMNGFNGTIMPTVFDKPSKLSTLATDPSDTYVSQFYVQKNVLYKGNVSVVNGEFTFSFFVPRDINYSFDFGKISYYAENGSLDATGYFDQFYVGGSGLSAVTDYEGPGIKLFMNDISFTDGGTTNENPVLLAVLTDSSGINTMGSSIGHDIIAILDNSGEVILLNDYYSSDLDSYKSGRVTYPFFDLEEGIHSVYFKAWDVFNNSSEALLTFIVTDSHDAVIKKMLNFPNPFSEYTDFIFEHNQSCTPIHIRIDIFNAIGQHVSSIETTQESLGYSTEPIRWYGVSHDGNPLGTGVYVYTTTITTCEGTEAHRSSRLVIVK
jgi:hypothetical protein